MRVYKSPSCLRSIACGKRAFILANGPSLREENLSLLKNELIIGINASPLLDEEFNLRHDFHVISDMRFLQSSLYDQLNVLKHLKQTTKVMRSDIAQYDKHSNCTETIYVSSLGRDGFSDNLLNGFYHGATTTMLALQLAVYTGCSEVVLMGCDLRYVTGYERFVHEANPRVSDRLLGVQLKNLVMSSNEIEKIGVKVYSCSQRSLLRPYLRFKKLEDFF